MQLPDFDRTDDGDFRRYVTRVADAGDEGEFELTIAGLGDLVEQVCADATIDLTIDSTQDESGVRKQFDATHKEQRRSMWELAGFEDIDQLLKPPPPRPDRKSSVFVSARPVSGDGTPFVYTMSHLNLPAGVSKYYFGTWVLYTWATITPRSGDQDLYLHFWSPTGPLLNASRLGGTSQDTVQFFLPVFPYVPVIRVYGYQAGEGNFVAWGA
jgi:hypothetical protein